MKCTLYHADTRKTLDDLLADAERQAGAWKDPKPSPDASKPVTPLERFTAVKDLYMAIDRPFGHLMYSLIRATGAQTVVEFGTSFGVSTIFLAAAVRDNGAGKVLTTEFIPEKVETAKKNLTKAGLADLIDFRVGDALQTLKDPMPGPVDFVFLDGEKSMYLDVLKVLEPQMKPGCLIAADNTDQDGTKTFLEYIREPDNGYMTSPLLTLGGTKPESGHEISVRIF